MNWSILLFYIFLYAVTFCRWSRTVRYPLARSFAIYAEYIPVVVFIIVVIEVYEKKKKKTFDIPVWKEFHGNTARRKKSLYIQLSTIVIYRRKINTISMTAHSIMDMCVQWVNSISILSDRIFSQLVKHIKFSRPHKASHASTTSSKLFSITSISTKQSEHSADPTNRRGFVEFITINRSNNIYINSFYFFFSCNANINIV